MADLRPKNPFRPEGFDFEGQDALRGVRCADCGECFFPPLPVCLQCQSVRVDPFALSKRAKIYSFTVVHRASSGFEAPYGCGWVVTEEGARVWSLFKGPVERLRVGLDVDVVFDKLGDRVVYFFQAAG